MCNSHPIVTALAMAAERNSLMRFTIVVVTASLVFTRDAGSQQQSSSSAIRAGLHRKLRPETGGTGKTSLQ